MDLLSLGRLICEQRVAQGLRLIDLAEAAGVGRSTLAALESGKLPELGFNKVARICAAAGILLETHPPLPYYPPRSLMDATGRELTKEVIADIILRSDSGAWHTLIRALKRDDRGMLAFRIRQVVGSLDRNDPKVADFTALLPGIMRRAIARAAERRQSCA
ncbi:MAG TPA: helix-turn-helix domain-containing protein [Steroidobacteraceae bacterium]|jgi:transcriptional regulator with XRE-family HTH domain|nr:helix-turn-helix domain-containing protein [Steroidobacteraceae bacterium]